MERRAAATPASGVGAPLTSVRPDGPVRVVGAAALVVLLVYTATALWRTQPGYDPLIDGWLRLTGHGLVALLAVLRAARVASQRALWTWVAVALVARSLGVIGFALFVRPLPDQSFPSIADAAWLISYVALFVALGLRAVERRRSTSLPLVLDGVVTALAVAAVAVAYLAPTVTEVAGEPTATVAAVVVNLSYLVLDAGLLVVLTGIMTAGRGPGSPTIVLLAAGIVTLAVVDVLFLQATVTGSFGSSSWLSPLSALSLTASALIAAAAWAPDQPPDPNANTALPRLFAPMTAALVCLGLLVLATTAALSPVAVGLATAGLVVVIARTLVTFRIVRSAAEHRRAARTDDLTGIANRRACNEALAALVTHRAADEEVSLVVLDLAGFRAINDAYGHHHGDQVLRLVADRLTSAVRDHDVLARIGGDVFAVVLDGAGPDTTAEIAERMLAAVRLPLPVGGNVLTLDASIGTATCPQDATDASELLRLADLAMFDAKSTGTGPQAYDPRRHVAAEGRRRIVDELRRGIEGDELVLHYQPQVDLHTGAVVGVEALVRWQHPRDGLLPPSAFLPIAESGGLMRPLTARVLATAVARTSAWHAAGYATTTAVNLSVTNLLDLELPGQLDRLFDTCDLAPRALTLELTEDLFIVDPCRAQRVVSALLERGVLLYVDDYGTGYSSMGYLRDLEGLAGLKLDRSFVGRIDVDPRARAIVSSTVSLAHALDLDVIAEGVETAAVGDILRDLGCTKAQGYLFSRPVPADQLDLGRRLPGA